MSNAFTAILAWVTQELPGFLIAEPVVYFMGAFVLLWVINLVARLIGGDFTSRR